MNYLMGNLDEETYKKICKIKGREPLNPIGSCFDSSAFLVVLDQGITKFTSVNLCHGLIVANIPGQEGREVPHAWVEAKENGQEIVLDAVWGEKIPKDEFYKITKPSMVHSYTKTKALQMWFQHDYPGPWHPRLIERQKELENGK